MRAAYPTPAALPGVPEEEAETSYVDKTRGLRLLLVSTWFGWSAKLTSSTARTCVGVFLGPVLLAVAHTIFQDGNLPETEVRWSAPA